MPADWWWGVGQEALGAVLAVLALGLLVELVVWVAARLQPYAALPYMRRTVIALIALLSNGVFSFGVYYLFIRGGREAGLLLWALLIINGLGLVISYLIMGSGVIVAWARRFGRRPG